MSVMPSGGLRDMVPARASHAAAVGAPLVVVLAALGVTVWATAADAQPLFANAAVWAATVTSSVVGAVVASARPRNPVGWAMLVGAALSMAGQAGVAVADHGLLHDPGSVAAPSAYAVSGAALRTAGWSLMTLVVPICFPDGRPSARRWGRLLHLAAACVVLGLFGSVFAAHAQLNELGHWHNPLSNGVLDTWANAAAALSFLLYAVTLAAAVARLVGRFRRGDALLRQQIGLFAAVAVLPVFAVVLGVAGITGAGMFGLTLLPLPIGISFAVLARGLYDLATATNRTMVWLTLSATLVGVYALVIGGLGSALRTPGAHWLPWLAAALVAVLFAPLRDVLQRGVNRLTFGRWDDPYRVLTTLGLHLEASADVDRLLASVAAELQAALHLKHVCVCDEHGAVLAGEEGPESADHRGPETVALVAYGRIVGQLRYRSPSPLRPGDRQVLGDLAGHLAGLLHAQRLTLDLQRARERLVVAREEERRRLRRDLHDGLGPSLAGHVLRVDLATRQVEPNSPACAGLEKLRADLQATVGEVRRIVEGLRPPALDEGGLGPALTRSVQRLTLGIEATCEVSIADTPPLSAAVEVAAFRIVNEAVANVVRHAGATSVAVAVRTDGAALQISVRDDGHGISPASPGGNGLLTMRERAEELGGTLTVTTTATGTEVRARLPLPAAVGREVPA